MLEDVLFRMNMYSLAAEHYNNMNNTMFVTPSIITTSFASFCSFLAATDPVHGKNISLFVGALGTCATIITAMQSAYKFDTKAEAFRTAAAEYRLLQTRIMGSMRKDKNLKEEWADLWKEVEMRMTELQKKMQYFPARHLVDNWNAQVFVFRPQGRQRTPASFSCPGSQPEGARYARSCGVVILRCFKLSRTLSPASF